jgi:hypothetical protein
MTTLLINPPFTQESKAMGALIQKDSVCWLTDKSLSQKAEMLWRVGIDKPQGEPAFWNQKPLINQNA